MLMHLIKQRIQLERDGASWHASIVNARRVDQSAEATRRPA
jgi:hypothetical protein